MLQAYIDESIDQSGIFVLGGYIATSEAWTSFAKEWEKILRLGTLKASGQYHFKMSEMAMNDERLARVPVFFRVIEDHVLGWVSAKINVAELRRALARISVPNVAIDWGLWGNPYLVAFRCLVDMFHLHRPRMVEAIPPEERIDFCFDNRVEKRAILAMWENYMQERPSEVKTYYGAAPVFKDDETCLPLQAADFWVWWVRKWYADGTPEKMRTCDFGSFTLRGIRKFLRIDISFNEDQLVTVMKRVLRTHIGPDRPIYDVKP